MHFLSEWHHTAEAAVWVDGCAQNVSSSKSDKMPKPRKTFTLSGFLILLFLSFFTRRLLCLKIVSNCIVEPNMTSWRRSDITVQLISVWMWADVAAVAELAVWPNHHHGKYLNILGRRCTLQRHSWLSLHDCYDIIHWHSESFFLLFKSTTPLDEAGYKNTQFL